ncbi:BREX system serine/threonine kinase PglW [Solwaraspora sp. WMMD937]|uniref:BREX system serine/threonine kinase PglW n=1 Tax=Solwaraspora sp. WMMD937 TaxID=3016090 RepID=UPI00249BB421|nr:BREX system serine/threonine kinase PglW [Solwaraspora sp. WMMD937]WFE22223.1 BREX system serine/threonine kinase PglW [Solwaraspora sp. WMMD937]
MRQDSPRWEQINPSGYEWEREGLRELASYLPDVDPYHVWANIEFVASDGSINEVDALVLTPSGLYVVELKHWQGELHGDGGQWVHRATKTSRLIPRDNPTILANRKAKRLASLIDHYARQQRKHARTPFIGAAVFLHARSLRSQLDAIGRQHVYGLHDAPESGLPSLREMLTAPPRNPAHLIDEVRGQEIVALVKGAKIRPSVADRKVGQLLLHPRPFAEGVGWQDFIAGHVMDTALLRRVRFYLTSRAPEEEIPAIRGAAEREFRLLQGIHHPGIAQAHDLVDHPLGPALIFDHQQQWVRLDQYLVERGDRLTLAQRLHLLGDLAEIVDYAHSRRLAHRALHPGAVYVCDPDSSRPQLVVTNWQTGGRLADTRLTRTGGSSTDPGSLTLLHDDEVRRYQAPEAAMPGRPPGHQLDVFALGAVGYRIFAGSPPAGSAEELATAVRDSGVNLAAAVDGMPAALVDAVYDATRGDPTRRSASVAAFRSRLEQVWDELTAPEPEPVVDPLVARKGDVLDIGYTVLSRLGAGSTALALLVSEPAVDGKDGRRLVLKVARDEQHAARLAVEAETLGKLRDRRVAALVRGPIPVGGRTALLMESAGERTLAEELHGGRLTLDLLERYGRDLLEIVVYLDEVGIWHRDLKPANLAARPLNAKDRQPHLCVFDFSLSATPTDQLTAGTAGYLDPFLGPPKRLRYDRAAERFAAAVTLFEMATGSLPEWGGANPAAVSDEVTLDPAMFEPAVADRLVDFFGRALARETADRFDTAEEMLDAWRDIFRKVPVAGGGLASPAAVSVASLDTVLEQSPLTERARSAVRRLGLVTVRDLLQAKPARLATAQGVPDATRKEILAYARSLRPLLAADPADRVGAADGAEQGRDGQQAAGVATRGMETLCAALLPADTGRTSKRRTTLAVLLGQEPAPGDDTWLHWPTQGEVARRTGQTQPQISTLLRKQVQVWSGNEVVSAVRDEIVALVESRGAVMSAAELADALIATHGSFTSEPKRSAQAVGLVRAAVETELATGGDARLAIQRFRASPTVLVGREPVDPAATTTAADLLSYVVALGGRATELVESDPLPTRQGAVAELAAVPPPPTMPVVPELRLLQLAAAGSNGRADVNGQGQLYPVDMPAERALRLAAGSIAGQRLREDEIIGRVRARFPRAQQLPGRPQLDTLVRTVAGLDWDREQRVYAPPALPSVFSGTRGATVTGGFAVPLWQADEVAAKLAGAIDRRAFLAVLTPLRELAAARRELLARLGLTEVDVTGILLDRLRALGYPWQALVAADSGSATDANFRSLVDLVRHEVVPAIRAALATDAPVLLTEAAPLARYGQVELLAELADLTRPRPAARLLLVPARKPDPAMLDGYQLPLTSPASQSLWISGQWLNARSGRTIHHAHPTAASGELPRVP